MEGGGRGGTERGGEKKGEGGREGEGKGRGREGRVARIGESGSASAEVNGARSKI